MLSNLGILFISFLLFAVQSMYVTNYEIIDGECNYNPLIHDLTIFDSDQCFFFTGYVCGTNQTFGTFKTDCGTTETVFTYSNGDCSGPPDNVLFGETVVLFLMENNQTIPIRCTYTK